MQCICWRETRVSSFSNCCTAKPCAGTSGANLLQVLGGRGRDCIGRMQCIEWLEQSSRPHHSLQIVAMRNAMIDTQGAKLAGDALRGHIAYASVPQQR